MSASGYGAVDKVSKTGDTMTGTLVLSAANPLQVTTGAPTVGKLLVSDASGNASWSGGAWIDYSNSFALTAATTNPTQGNSTYVARYQQIGKTVEYAFNITIGSTFSAGSGTYYFSLPVPAVTSVVYLGAGLILKNGVGYTVAAVNTADANHALMIRNGDTTSLGSAGPGSAWGANDLIRGAITYEAA